MGGEVEDYFYNYKLRWSRAGENWKRKMWEIVWVQNKVDGGINWIFKKGKCERVKWNMILSMYTQLAKIMIQS